MSDTSSPLSKSFKRFSSRFISHFISFLNSVFLLFLSSHVVQSANVKKKNPCVSVTFLTEEFLIIEMLLPTKIRDIARSVPKKIADAKKYK